MTDPLAQDFRLAVGRVARRLRRLFVDSAEGLAFLELAVLHRLADGVPRSPGELASDEGVTGPAVAAVLRHLTDLGLLHRDRDATDGRRAVLTVTPAGRRALATRDAAVTGRIHAVLHQHLDAADRATLAAALPVLEKVARSL